MSDEEWRVATQGEHFTCSPQAFRTLVYQAAKKRGRLAETKADHEKRTVAFRTWKEFQDA
jgi:hypothetical protein